MSNFPKLLVDLVLGQKLNVFILPPDTLWRFHHFLPLQENVLLKLFLKPYFIIHQSLLFRINCISFSASRRSFCEQLASWMSNNFRILTDMYIPWQLWLSLRLAILFSSCVSKSISISCVWSRAIAMGGPLRQLGLSPRIGGNSRTRREPNETLRFFLIGIDCTVRGSSVLFPEGLFSVTEY